jgi:hypothetical protein
MQRSLQLLLTRLPPVPRKATDVTFNLKDFKCMVQLCEAMPANMIIRFDQPGAPLVVEPHLSHGMAEVSIISQWLTSPGPRLSTPSLGFRV